MHMLNWQLRRRFHTKPPTFDLDVPGGKVSHLRGDRLPIRTIVIYQYRLRIRLIGFDDSASARAYGQGSKQTQGRDGGYAETEIFCWKRLTLRARTKFGLVCESFVSSLFENDSQS